MLYLQVFDTLRQERPEALKKLVPMRGDITMDKLGLSWNDTQTLIENVSVVFHSAARVRFDFDMRTALEMNVRGLQRVMQLCRQLKLLEANSILYHYLHSCSDGAHSTHQII